jgi:hypothetical protein
VFRRLLIAGVMLSLSLAVTQVVSAQGPEEKVSLVDQYQLRDGQVHDGSLTVMAREVTFAEGSVVNGDVSIISPGDVILDGQINGNVSILARNTNLGEHLAISGNLTICSQNSSQSPAASIRGNQSTGCNQLGSVLRGVTRGSAGLRELEGLWGDPGEHPIVSIFRTIFTALAVAALAALGAAIFPRQVNRMTGTAMTTFATMTLVGFLSMGVVFAITIVYLLSIVFTLGLTCLAIPVVGFGWLVVGAALITGWIAVSAPVGTMVLHRLKIYPTPMVAAAVGTLVTTLAQGLLGMVPCLNVISWLAVVVLGSAGFGAVLLTRFGTRSYPEIITARAGSDIL